MMAKYIDVDNYCKNICRCAKEHCDKNKCPILTAPAADVVEVVRCEECKHLDTQTAHCDHILGTNLPIGRKGNDFCSYGDRKK